MSDDVEYTESGQPVYRHTPKDRDFEPAFGDARAIGAISRHVGRYVGPVGHVFHEVVSDLVHIDVHLVPPQPGRPFVTLVTSGMSDRPMALPPDCDAPAVAELLLCLPADWPLEPTDFKDEANFWPIRLLKFLARLPHEYDTWLGFGHTVPNGDPPQPYADGTGLCCALIVPPTQFDSRLDQLALSDDKVIQFYAVVPLYREEMAFKLRHGSEELLRRFTAAGVCELLDPHRPNVCAGE
jgi:Suppressor of fused protein (SUFU)